VFQSQTLCFRASKDGSKRKFDTVSDFFREFFLLLLSLSLKIFLKTTEHIQEVLIFIFLGLKEYSSRHFIFSPQHSWHILIF
jgi:hypothetical protein